MPPNHLSIHLSQGNVGPACKHTSVQYNSVILDLHLTSIHLSEIGLENAGGVENMWGSSGACGLG